VPGAAGLGLLVAIGIELAHVILVEFTRSGNSRHTLQLSRRCAPKLQRAPFQAGTDLSAIADMTGFASLSAFSRWFHGRFGVSPTTWRIDEQGGNRSALSNPLGKSL
jgi:AraC-like DNA-binding protein